MKKKLTKGGACIPGILPPGSASEFGQKEEISLLHDQLLPCLKVRLQEAHSKHITLQSVKVIAKFTKVGPQLVVTFFQNVYFYHPQRSWGKVIFSQASVILLTGGVCLVLGGVCSGGCLVPGGLL